MAFDGKHALSLLDRIGDNNAKKEFYLTDAVALARADPGAKRWQSKSGRKKSARHQHQGAARRHGGHLQHNCAKPRSMPA